MCKYTGIDHLCCLQTQTMTTAANDRNAKHAVPVIATLTYTHHYATDLLSTYDAAYLCCHLVSRPSLTIFEL